MKTSINNFSICELAVRLKKNKARITELCESLGNLSQQVETIRLENDTLLVSFALTIGDRGLAQKRHTDQGRKKKTNLLFYNFKVNTYLCLEVEG